MEYSKAQDHNSNNDSIRDPYLEDWNPDRISDHDDHSVVGKDQMDDASGSLSSVPDHISGSSEAAKAEKRGGTASSVLRFILTIAAIVIFAFVLRTFVFQSYEIPSGSMEDTIMPGDLVFAEKVSTYFGVPTKGSVITFADPETADNPNPEMRRTLIKRLIATGGQTVDLIEGEVYIDGVKQDEPYTEGKPTFPINTAGSVGIEYPYLVPEGHLWMMGDNRTSSQDSRYFGAIPVTSIQGHALFKYWPLSDIGWL